MIPKIIHYCWFGKKEFPIQIQNCIESWKRYCPDYKFILWNESNFDIQSNEYVREAYSQSKFAFVSDYARLYALKEYGGIYLDTDVEVKKNLDVFLNYDLVVGFEAVERVATAVIMASKDNPIIAEWMDDYETRHYIQGKRTDDTTNVMWLTRKLQEYGLKLNGEKQCLLNDGVIVCEKDAFCPYSIGDKIKPYNNSYAVHWCDGSWVTGNNRRRFALIKLIKRCIGTDAYELIRRKLKGI